MRTSKFKITFACVLSILLILSMTSCGTRKNITMDAVYEANKLAKIMENHTSVHGEYKYYENMDNTITYTTYYSYSESGSLDDGPVYSAMGKDAVDDVSADNYQYCIINNEEYQMEQDNTITTYLLLPSYMDELRDSSISLFYTDFGDVTSAKVVEDTIIITAESGAIDLYGQETVDHLTSLVNDTLTTIESEYIVDEESLLLHKVNTYFVSKKGTKYLFSEHSITYDQGEPDISFAESYVNAKETRKVTIVEKKADGDVSNIYTLPATVSPNFQNFTSFFGYTIYGDSNLTQPFTVETPNEDGKYGNIIVYAARAEETVQQ